MKQYKDGLYVSIEEHDGVHDYEFYEGEVINVSQLRHNEFGDCEFYINSVSYRNEATCTCNEFEESFAELDTSGAWFKFREDIDSDCYNVLDANLREVVMTRDAEDIIYLCDIEYIESEDLLSGVVDYVPEEDMFPEIREKYTRVLIPRFAVSFVGY